jgi:regulator of sigma E protease
MKKLLVGEISTKNLSGPIGIAKVAGDHARAGLVYFVEFLAILSVYLGVLNLLPIPVLDGGHILYSIAEAIKGSPLSERVQMFGYSLGLVILAGVMVMAFYNDLLRL